MADPVRIRDIPHGIKYHSNESANSDLSGVSTSVLKECMFRTKNAAYRAKTSQIEAPTRLYKDLYNHCKKELKNRNEIKTDWRL